MVCHYMQLTTEKYPSISSHLPQNVNKGDAQRQTTALRKDTRLTSPSRGELPPTLTPMDELH